MRRLGHRLASVAALAGACAICGSVLPFTARAAAVSSHACTTAAVSRSVAAGEHLKMVVHTRHALVWTLSASLTIKKSARAELLACVPGSSQWHTLADHVWGYETWYWGFSDVAVDRREVFYVTTFSTQYASMQTLDVQRVDGSHVVAVQVAAQGSQYEPSGETTLDAAAFDTRGDLAWIDTYQWSTPGGHMAIMAQPATARPAQSDPVILAAGGPFEQLKLHAGVIGWSGPTGAVTANLLAPSTLPAPAQRPPPCALLTSGDVATDLSVAAAPPVFSHTAAGCVWESGVPGGLSLSVGERFGPYAALSAAEARGAEAELAAEGDASIGGVGDSAFYTGIELDGTAITDPQTEDASSASLTVFSGSLEFTVGLAAGGNNVTLADLTGVASQVLAAVG